MGQLTPAQQAQLRNNGKAPAVGRGQTPGPNVPLNAPRNQPPTPPKPSVPPFASVPSAASFNPWQPTPAGAPQLPPNQNGPIFPDDSQPGSTPGGTQAIAFNGGYYNPTTAPFGFDMTTPGVNEQFWNNNQNLWFQSPQLDWVDSQLPQFQDPWQGEQQVSSMLGTIANPGAGQQYWTGVQGQFNKMGNDVMGGYGGPNNAQEAYGMTKGMLPGSMQPKFDAYYDRMKDKVMSDVDSQSAARGVYGSNSALNNSIGAGLDVEANRAKANTDFMLADSKNQANWQGLLGNQARAADLSGLGIFDSKLRGAQFGLDKTKLGGDLAFQAEGMDFDKKKTQADLAFGLDDQKLERLGAGISTAFNSQQAHRGQLTDAFDASNIVQGNREDRINTLHQQLSGFSRDVQNFFSDNYDALLSGDQKSFEASIDAKLAQYADQRGWSDTQTAEMKQDLMDAADTFFSITGKPKT